MIVQFIHAHDGLLFVWQMNGGQNRKFKQLTES